MATSAIPTLRDLNKTMLTDPGDIVSYLVAFINLNPGNTSILHEGAMGSMGRLNAIHGAVPEELAAKYTEMFQTIMDNALPGVGVVVDVSAVEVGTSEQKLVIDIRDLDGNPLVSRTENINTLLEMNHAQPNGSE